MDNSDQTLTRMYQSSATPAAPQASGTIAVPTNQGAATEEASTAAAGPMLTTLVLSLMGIITVAVWVMVLVQGK